MFCSEVEEYEDAAETVDNNLEANLENASLKKVDNTDTKSEQAQPLNPEQQKLEVKSSNECCLLLYILIQRQVRRYLAEGKVQSFSEGELVAKLIDEQWPEDEVCEAHVAYKFVTSFNLGLDGYQNDSRL